MKKGEVWWAGLPAPVGRRPVLLLSRDEAYTVRLAVTVAPLTTTVRRIPVEVPLAAREGVPRVCVVNCDDIMTIRKNLLEERITALSEGRMNEIHRAIAFALDLP